MAAMIREWLRRPHPYPPQVEIEPTPGERLESLREQLRDVDAKLALLNTQFREFKTRHGVTADRFQRIFFCLGASIGDRAQIESQWRTMVKKSDSLFFERNRILREFAQLKEATK